MPMFKKRNQKTRESTPIPPPKTVPDNLLPSQPAESTFGYTFESLPSNDYQATIKKLTGSPSTGHVPYRLIPSDLGAYDRTAALIDQMRWLRSTEKGPENILEERERPGYRGPSPL